MVFIDEYPIFLEEILYFFAKIIYKKDSIYDIFSGDEYRLFFNRIFFEHISLKNLKIEIKTFNPTTFKLNS